MKDTSDEHKEWVTFQQKIAVKGFETGQDTEIKNSAKRRGGKAIRMRRERDLKKLAEKKQDMIAGGGEFPPEVWSEEETDELLKEAWGNLPPREGRRGNNHLKREKLRWQKKRMYDAKKKYERMLEHERRMAKRGAIADACKTIRKSSEEVRSIEKEYQERMYKQWAVNMVASSQST